jgi:hypothetical protein
VSAKQKRKLQARTFLFLAGALSAFPSIKLECYFSHWYRGMQYLGYLVRGQTFHQGQISTATKISRVEITPVLRESQSFNVFRPLALLSLPFMRKPRTYEVDCQVWVENPQRYVSHCTTSRIVSGDSKEVCTIYIFPIFASTSEENYSCTFTISFEVTETSITEYKFVLLDPLRDSGWESEIVRKMPPAELLV